MPRTARASGGGTIDQTLNRGNCREVVFLKPADDDAVVEAAADARRRLSLDLFGS